MGNIHGHGPNCHDTRPRTQHKKGEKGDLSDALSHLDQNGSPIEKIEKFSGEIAGDKVISRDIQGIIFRLILGPQKYHEEPGKFTEKNWVAIRDWINCQLVCKSWAETCWEMIPKDFATRVLQRVCRISGGKWVQHAQVANKLLNHGADPSADDSYSLQVAAERGHTDVVEALLNREGVDPSANEHHAIYYAAKYGHEGVVRILLGYTEDSYVQSSRMLEAALQGEKWEVILVLMKDPRTNITIGNHKVLIKACDQRWGGSSVLRELLQDGRLDPSAQENACLKIAAERGNEKLVKILLEDPRVDPYAHRNAIIKAVGHGSSAIVKMIKDATKDRE